MFLDYRGGRRKDESCNKTMHLGVFGLFQVMSNKRLHPASEAKLGHHKGRDIRVLLYILFSHHSQDGTLNPAASSPPQSHVRDPALQIKRTPFTILQSQPPDQNAAS